MKTTILSSMINALMFAVVLVLLFLFLSLPLLLLLQL